MAETLFQEVLSQKLQIYLRLELGKELEDFYLLGRVCELTTKDE